MPALSDETVVVALRLLSRSGILGGVVVSTGMVVVVVSAIVLVVVEAGVAASLSLLYDGFRGIPFVVTAAASAAVKRVLLSGDGEADVDGAVGALLAVLLMELENAESLDAAVELDCAPSVLESSSEYRGLSSKLVTVRMVEFMRFGGCAEDDGESVADVFVELLEGVLVVAVRDIAALDVPSEVAAGVDCVNEWSIDVLDGVELGERPREESEAAGSAGTVTVGGSFENAFEVS